MAKTGRTPKIDTTLVAELREAGATYRSVARELGISQSSVYRLLRKIRVRHTTNTKPQLDE